MMTAFDSILTKMMISAFFYPKTLLFICFIVVLFCAAAVFLLLKQHKRLLLTEERLNTAEETLEAFRTVVICGCTIRSGLSGKRIVRAVWPS